MVKKKIDSSFQNLRGLGGEIFWWSQRESNPCFRRERPTSWAARRWDLRRILIKEAIKV